MRHAAFLGLRLDKSAKTVQRESPFTHPNLLKDEARGRLSSVMGDVIVFIEESAMVSTSELFLNAAGHVTAPEVMRRAL